MARFEIIGIPAILDPNQTTFGGAMETVWVVYGPLYDGTFRRHLVRVRLSEFESLGAADEFVQSHTDDYNYIVYQEVRS